ncbi:MAG: site-specific DNA-methyltransferase [Deltaproteobacteria bacterium]|jgi:modification methylase|nr:site-specific DNA-methyltransferase [Deltaproteobacteria bacterium]
MKTIHNFIFSNSKKMGTIPSSSVHLVVTSPPYPMIEMWDDMFKRQSNEITKALKHEQGLQAFELMHRELDPVWKEIYRILIDGGIACINIGDAVRTMDDEFRLYPNHSRILAAMLKTGFSALPLILWRKPTNAPNKFMGSGMLPAGAYVTLEHEYILILRKGPKREFSSPLKKQTRREGAFFWEERNNWFSDVWFGLIGTTQKMKNNTARLRSAAFPFELAYRLVNMYSTKEDTVVDPFLGTGTTMFAAMATGRNSIGFEIESGFRDEIVSIKDRVIDTSNDRIHHRIQNHLAFVQKRSEDKGNLKYVNKHYKFPVVTRQEVELFFNPLKNIEQIDGNTMTVTYSEVPQENFEGDWKEVAPSQAKKSKGGQLQLF